MDYRFREIRKSERAQVLDFAKAQGCKTPEPQTLHHHLSLMAKADGQLVAAAMCIETKPAQFMIEIVHGDTADTALITELADRCLRKVQSENITSARINSPHATATQQLWTATNWLDRIEETPPPECDVDVSSFDGDSSQAA